jgi:hypothetical protein
VSFPADDWNGSFCDSEMSELGIEKFIILFDWFMYSGLEKVSDALDAR